MRSDKGETMKISDPMLEIEMTKEEFIILTKFILYINTILPCHVSIKVVERNDGELKCICSVEE